MTEAATYTASQSGSRHERDVSAASKADTSKTDVRGPAPRYDLIELLFFAYRDFIGDPDRRLADYGFGRAHHRVLHFVDRRPGLTIAELLDILRITKQSLNRVLKELIEKEFVAQQTGAEDRRQRLLFTTPAGHDLAVELAQLQTRRIARALSGEPAELTTAAARFLLNMIDPAARASIPHLGADEREALP